MSKKKVFSIIVLNYNNFELLFQMIDTIYNQTYENMELIIMDDASDYFDKDKVLEYVDKKRNNIKIKIVVNKENIGTVKTINKSLKYATGDYYLITASDDAFADNEVISNYVKYFDMTNCNIVTAQWIKCNINLKRIRNYIPDSKFKEYNEKPDKMLFEMCKSNRFGAGATAYKKEIFDKYHFDENYKYLEDWPFWLKLLFKKEKIYLAQFDSLLHRSGGISEATEIKDSTKQFYQELLDCTHKEIIPNLKKFSYYQQWSILDSYKYNIEYYEKYFDTSKNKKELYKIVSKNKKIKKRFVLNKINPHIIEKIKNMFKNNRIVPRTFIVTMIISFILTIFIKNNYLILLAMIVTYLVIYIGLVMVREVRRSRKWKSIQ